MTIEEVKEIFKKQLEYNISLKENEKKSFFSGLFQKSVYTFFKTKIRPKDSILYLLIVDDIHKTEIEFKQIVIVERDLEKLIKKYILDFDLTKLRFESVSPSIKTPVFINRNLYNEYLKLKGK